MRLPETRWPSITYILEKYWPPAKGQPAWWGNKGARRIGDFRTEILYPCFLSVYCRLYIKFNCRRMTLPLNSAGSGGKGFEALIPATAARSRASAPEGVAITSLGTAPSLLIAN